MKQFTSQSQKIGEIGENIVSRFLMKQGFEVVERNYTKKWGEIDIIAKKGNKIHFIEVKSVSRENLNNVSHETGEYRPKTDLCNKAVRSNNQNDCFRPEDNMHPKKLERLSRAVETYLLERNVSPETEWQFDLATVYLDLNNKKSKVNLIWDIII